MKLTTPDHFEIDVLFKPIPQSKKIVVFCHGMTVNKYDEEKFTLAAEELNEIGFSTLLFDFRAHGKSSGDPKKDFTISGELIDLETVLQFVKAEGFEWIGLAGASFGGGMACLYAGKYPDDIDALFLANPVLDFKKTFLYPVSLWAVKFFSNVFERLQDKGFIEIGSRKMRVGRKLFEQMKDYSPIDELQKYDGPVLAVHGDADTKVSYAQTKQLFETLKNPHKKWITMEGSEHGFHDEPYESQVVKMIVVFFEEEGKNV